MWVNILLGVVKGLAALKCMLTPQNRILLIGVTVLNAVGPFHQHFALQNYTIQYPFAVHERVPVVLLYFVAVVCPAVIIAIYTLVIDGIFSHQKQASAPRDSRRALGGKYRFKDRLWELNCGILGLLTSNVAAYTITGVLKNATGKPRPDFIDRCRPLQGSADPPVFGLSNSIICTQTDHGILKDGFKSFPSGHCSSRLWEVKNLLEPMSADMTGSLICWSLLSVAIPRR